MQKLYSMDIHEPIWRCCVLPGKLLLGVVGDDRNKLFAWDIKACFRQPVTELVDSLRLQHAVTALLPLEFTQHRFFCVGYGTGEMAVFDSHNMDIAEEVQFLQDPLDILIECTENQKLRSCIVGASYDSSTIRLVSFRVNQEQFVDIGMIKLRSHVTSIVELGDLNLAVSQQNGEVELWNLKQTEAPHRILKTYDLMVNSLISIE